MNFYVYLDRGRKLLHPIWGLKILTMSKIYLLILLIQLSFTSLIGQTIDTVLKQHYYCLEKGGKDIGTINLCNDNIRLQNISSIGDESNYKHLKIEAKKYWLDLNDTAKLNLSDIVILDSIEPLLKAKIAYIASLQQLIRAVQNSGKAIGHEERGLIGLPSYISLEKGIRFRFKNPIYYEMSFSKLIAAESWQERAKTQLFHQQLFLTDSSLITFDGTVWRLDNVAHWFGYDYLSNKYNTQFIWIRESVNLSKLDNIELKKKAFKVGKKAIQVQGLEISFSNIQKLPNSDTLFAKCSIKDTVRTYLNNVYLSQGSRYSLGNLTIDIKKITPSKVWVVLSANK